MMARNSKTGHLSRLPGVLGLLGLLLLVVTPSPAMADDLVKRIEKDRRQANELYRRANLLNERGMYSPALKLYHQARRLYPSFKIDLNIGGVLDAMGRLTDAAAYFHRFLVNSIEAPEEITRIARERLDELKKKTASVKVSGLVEGAAVQIGGVTRGLTPLVIPVYLNPGVHKVEVQKKGFTTFSTTVTLKLGQHVPLALPLDSAFIKRKAKPPEPVAKPCPAPKPCPKPLECPSKPGMTISRARTIGAWTAVGVGAALAVTGAALYGVGTTSGNEAYDAYINASNPADISAHWEDVESNRNLVIAGQVLLGTVALAAGTAIYLFATRAQEAPSPAPAGESKVTFTPGLGGGSLSVTF